MEIGINRYEGVECDMARGEGSWGPVVLLHGYSFTWKVWNDIGLLQELEARGYRYLAPDMPYGRYSSCTRKTRDVDFNLSIVRALVTPYKESPVLLGASLGGYIALRYAAAFPVRGLVLIAPVGVRDPELKPLYEGSPPPTLIIYGDRDSIVSIDDMRLFERSMEGSKLLIYEKAGHAAYLDAPKRFIKDVLDFLETIKNP